MSTKKDPRVDAYIANVPPAAKPLFMYVRKVVHASCPGVEETLKWGKPWYMYQGKVLCGTVAFKAHSAWIFNKRSQIAASGPKGKSAMLLFKHLTSVKELPSASALKTLIKQAMKLNEPGAPKVTRVIKPPKPPAKAPADLMLALKSHPEAAAGYKAFSEAIKRNYVNWILEAKTEETREKRIERAVDCMAAGKKKHWL